MNTFAILLLCIQACLVQSIFGQCAGRIAAPVGYTGTAYGYATPAVVAPYAYGNYGYGTCGCGGLGGVYGSLGGVYGSLGGIYGAGLGCGRTCGY